MKEEEEEEEKEMTAKEVNEALASMFLEADGIVKQMLAKPYKDVVEFKDACVSKIVSRLCEASPDIDSEVAVALAFILQSAEHLISSHPGAVAVLDKDESTVDNTIRFER